MRTYLICAILILISTQAITQCTVVANSNISEIYCGQEVELSAFGTSSTPLLDNDFNASGNQPGNGWAATTAAMYTNPCGPSPDGTAHLWMGDFSSQPRVLETQTFDLSPGGSICFDLKFATQAGTSPCEGPDEPDEGVYLQYSTDGGVNWNTINYFDPNGGYDATLTEWNNYCFDLNSAAMTNSVSIRWFQDASTSDAYDHWGIDNVLITLNDVSYYYEWLHDGSNEGVNPTPVMPLVNTTYDVIYTNGIDDTCTAQIDVQVSAPLLNVNAGNDTTICPGTCIDLPGEAALVSIPGGVREICDNTEVDILPGGFLSASILDFPITVDGLNGTTVNASSIQSVCFNIDYDGNFFFGDLGNLQVSLVCPGGTELILVPQNGASGSDFTNTCFGPSGNLLATGNAPYSGTFSPAFGQSLENAFLGCDLQGEWIIRVRNESDFIGGTFLSGCITVKDEDQEFPAMFSWSPNTDMVNENTLNPTVCPSSQTTYTITAQDSNQCTTATDDITVDVANGPACCPFTFSPTINFAGACGGVSNDISVNIQGGSGNYSYAWSNGATSNTNNNIANGQYGLTVTDNTFGCSKDTLFILQGASGSSPSIDNIQVSSETCSGSNNGTAQAFVSGGSAPLSFSWISVNNTNTSDYQNNIAPGNYQLAVVDASGCSDTLNYTIAPGPELSTSFVVNESTCDTSNGAVAQTVIGGSGNYTYAWSNGQTSEDLVDVDGGNYQLLVTDLNTNCTLDTSVVVASFAAPMVNPTITNEECPGDNNGKVTLLVFSSQTPITYTWPTTPNIGTSAGTNASNIAPGTYTATVTDIANCSTEVPFTITTENWVSFDAAITNSTCGQANGSVDLTVTGGSNNLNYIWDNSGLGPQDSLNIMAGTYQISVQDNITGCEGDTTIQVFDSGFPTGNVQVLDETCTGIGNGQAIAQINDGALPYQFDWSANITNYVDSHATNLTSGNYTVTVTDAIGCELILPFMVSSPGPCCDITLQVSAPDIICTGQTADLTTMVGGASGNYQYSWSDGSTTDDLTGVIAGSYAVTVYDDLDPTCKADTSLNVFNSPDIAANIDLTHESCINAQDGSALIKIGSGAAPFTLNWDATLLNVQDSFADQITPGNYTVTITDVNGCSEVETFFINASSDCCPILMGITTNDVNCFNLGNLIVNASGAANTYQYSIDGSAAQVSNTFLQLPEGQYLVSAIGDDGCTQDSLISIQMGDTSLQVSFEYTPSDPSTLEPTVWFENTSETASELTWYFDALDSSRLIDPVFEFPDTAEHTYEVCLKFRKGSCEKVICKDIFVQGHEYLYVPNTFTPDGNQDNELFYPVMSYTEKDYELTVRDRWGNVMFLTNNTEDKWDGTDPELGLKVQEGIYLWTIKFSESFAGRKKHTGKVLVLPNSSR